MKTVLKTTAILILVIMTLTSCVQGLSNGVKGNGKITKEIIEVAAYDKVEVIGSMTVTLVKGKEGAITVTTDENLHEFLDITSNGDILKITFKNSAQGLSSKKGVNILVPFTDINAVSLVGSGDITGKDRVTANNLDVSLVGSGDIELTVDTSDLDGILNGSGDIRLRGNTTNLKAKVSGSGDFRAKSLQADHTEAYLSGSGDLDVFAKKSIKARVNGSGDISYSGNPEKVDTKISGSGDIDAN